MSKRKRVLVSGMIAGDPWQGGASWAVLQYILGLRQLGHDVYFVEPIDGKAILPTGARLEDSENAAYFRQITELFGLNSTSALVIRGTRTAVGLDYGQLSRISKTADVLLNISGMLREPELAAPMAVRVYLDLDPGFNQLWQAVQGIDMRFDGHTHFVTVGQALGLPDCAIPTCGRHWLKTFQPVVLNHWPKAGTVTYDGLTTIANWRGYGSIEYQGQSYGQKAHSLRRFLALPTLTREKFLLAMSIHPDETKDLAALKANSWHLLDPAQVAGSPTRYQQFIQRSKAEFGIAKSGYVVSACGWFSDRSACYLASGRPVIAQETGFSRYLPTGQGLFSFRTTEDVLVAIEELNRDYPGHARQARSLAEEFFDSNKVLNRLLEQIGA
jgi:hypothetical protein